MTGMFKIAAVSALLSAGFVTAHDISKAGETVPVSGKAYTDRVSASGTASVPFQVAYAGVNAGDRRAVESAASGKGDSQREKPAKSCEAQTWPNVARHCIAAPGGEPRKLVRTITIESREGANTSVLSRVPVAMVAQR